VLNELANPDVVLVSGVAQPGKATVVPPPPTVTLKVFPGVIA
jgi:hypothetical protein